ncbi:hypothetical protein GCM10027425_15640 [Alteromonas gracilis]
MADLSAVPRATPLPAQPPRECPDTAHLVGAPWRLLAAAGTVEARHVRPGALRALPLGTPVCLVEDRLLARARLRRLARRAGIEIERELIVLPTLASAVVVLDDAPEAVAAFWERIAATPPGVARAHGAADLGVRVARRLPWQVTGAVAPGRVLLGWRAR